MAESDLEQAAYERGKQQAYVLSELDSHEKRLNAINGSIERHAKQAQGLKDAIERLRGDLANIAASLATRDAVEKDRNDQLERANNQQISSRQFWIGVLAIIATLVGAVIASHHGLG